MIQHHNIYMQKALKLAVRAKGRTSPNPMVGAVIVKAGKIIASDYHRKAGTPHAEILALKKAGEKVKGATLYINLEPCCHTDKKTPPCTKSIIQSGIKKVVAAMFDPNPKVCGKGIKELQNAGIETEVGVMEAEAKKLNEAFIKFITEKKPFVILKIAQSLDGKIATSAGESRWITGEKARNLVHRMRKEVDAVLVGIGTVKKDNPSLDCRIKGGRNPYRIILDSNLDISPYAKVLKHNDNKTIIAAIHQEWMGRFSGRNKEELIKDSRRFQKKIDLLKSRGVNVLVVKAKNGKIDLKDLMKELGKSDIASVMIEGGSSVNASAVSSGVVDKVMFFIAPKIICGTDAVSSFGGKSPLHLENAVKIKDIHIKKTGDDLLLEGYI